MPQLILSPPSWGMTRKVLSLPLTAEEPPEGPCQGPWRQTWKLPGSSLSSDVLLHKSIAVMTA